MVKPSGQTAAATKTRILDAADAVFVRRGIDSARMQDIADQAGVNKALLHYHFRSLLVTRRHDSGRRRGDPELEMKG